MPIALMRQRPRKAQLFGILILEAAVIFAGITASFWMEEWREQREDLDTYHHLLEEIYYNAVIDESRLPLSIADNNLALRNALELSVLNSELPPDPELWEGLNHIFSGAATGINTAGYVRLSNTSLSIPFDETMVTLDDAFAGMGVTRDGMGSIDAQIGELRAKHWRSAGMVSCSGAVNDDGSIELMDQPYMAEIRELLYPDGECITQAENDARARDLMTRSDFRNAIRQIIELRQGTAWLIGWQESTIGTIKTAVEARLPDVGLPIVSIELIHWARETYTETEVHTSMRQSGPHTWEATVELPEGFIKFKGNEDWSINWGAPFPNIIDAPGYLWSSDQVRVEDVFPSGTADLHGMNLPVRAGTYRVSFNSRTFEYRFDDLEPGRSKRDSQGE